MTDPFKSVSVFNKLFNLKKALKNLNDSNPFILNEHLGIFPNERPGVDHLKLLSQSQTKYNEEIEEYGRVHWAHPLGPLDLEGIQNNIQTQIAEIKEIIQAHSDLIKRLLNVPQGETMEPTKKIYNNLKNEALLGSRIFNIRHTLSQVKYGLLSNIQPSQIGLPFYINSIERIAEESRIHYYIDRNELVTITLSGHYIVIDIDLNQEGQVVKANVTYAETEREESKAKLPFFEDLAQGDMDSFRFDLKLLLAIDQLNYQFPNIDLFHNLHSLYNDLNTIYNQELMISNGDLNQLLNLGMGIPLRDQLWMGLTVIYSFKTLEVKYQTSQELLDSSTKQYIKDTYYSLHITTQLSKTSTVLLPKMIKGTIYDERNANAISPDVSTFTTQPFQITPLMSHPLQMILQYPGMESMAAPLQYVMVLNPPIHCSEVLAKRIAQVAGILVNDQPSIDGSAFGMDSLQTLLIKETVERDNQVNYYGNDYLANSQHWIGRFKNNPFSQNYRFTGDRCGSYTVYRIPFQRLDQVYSTIQLLRQQIAFNRLFQSCFNSNTFRPWLDKTKQRSEIDTIQGNIQVEIASINPPESLIITFLHPNQQHYVTLNITIPQDTPLPIVTMTTLANTLEDGDTLPDVLEALPSEKLTQVLQICFSIPLLIKWTLDRIVDVSTLQNIELVTNQINQQAKKLKLDD